jgi:BASS family bile acid:Na+ symporter
MTALELIHLAIPVSMGLIVLSLGMRCTPSEALFLVREPGLLARSILSMNVLMPIAAGLLMAVTGVSEPVKIALIALAVSPVPPILPNKQLKLVTRDAYIYGLLVATSILSILLVPLSLRLIGGPFSREVFVDPSVVARSVAISVLVPLAIGILARQMWPDAVERFSRVIGTSGDLTLVAGLVFVLFSGRHAFAALLGDGTLAVCIVLSLIGLLIGHWLGGRNEDDRTVLALATASRHPGVAIAIAGAVFPGQKAIAVAVLLYMLVGVIASVPYTRWRKRRHQRVIGVNPHEHPPLHR